MLTKTEVVKATEHNSSFSKTHPGVQIAWDSTSLGLLKECPRKYYYSLIEGWESKKQSPHLTFGLLVHSGLETYDHIRAKGGDHEEGVRATVQHCLEESGTRGNAFWCEDCGKYDKNKEFCSKCDNKLEFRRDVWFPWKSDMANKNRETLVRACVWYLEQFKDDPCITIILANGKPAVELSFKLDAPFTQPNGDPYIFCGHLDRVVEYGDAVYVLDRKTTGATISVNFFEGFSPDNQVSLYIMAGQIIYGDKIRGMIIDGIQAAIDFTKFHRGFVNRTPQQIEEWLIDQQFWIKQAEQYALQGYWPMNDKSCSHYASSKIPGQFGCPFRTVCTRDSGIRNNILRTEFIPKTWDPLKSR